MNLLIDTHILLWWTTGDRRLSSSARELIADTDNAIAVSAATLWELAIKRALGRVDVDLTELIAAITADGFEELPIRFAHTLPLESLPAEHGDPFDRLLIAQAMIEGMQLLTADEAILRYSNVDGLAVIRA